MHKSARTVWLKMVSKSASLRSAAGCSSRTVGNLFVGGYHEEEPWKQRNSSRADHWCHCVQSRYTPRRLSVLPLQRRSFVGQGLSPEALPPCSCRVERVVVENPLSRVGHTHTHTSKQSDSSDMLPHRAKTSLQPTLPRNTPCFLRNPRQHPRRTRRSDTARASNINQRIAQTQPRATSPSLCPTRVFNGFQWFWGVFQWLWPPGGFEFAQCTPRKQPLSTCINDVP